MLKQIDIKAILGGLFFLIVLSFSLLFLKLIMMPFFPVGGGSIIIFLLISFVVLMMAGYVTAKMACDKAPLLNALLLGGLASLVNITMAFFTGMLVYFFVGVVIISLFFVTASGIGGWVFVRSQKKDRISA